jgi:hypothetical protein
MAMTYLERYRNGEYERSGRSLWPWARLSETPRYWKTHRRWRGRP